MLSQQWIFFYYYYFIILFLAPHFCPHYFFYSMKITLILYCINKMCSVFMVIYMVMFVILKGE